MNEELKQIQNEEDIFEDSAEEKQEETGGQEEYLSGADKNQILLAILMDMKGSLENAINVLGGADTKAPGIKIENSAKGQTKIIEGVFSGDKMIGPDGKSYNIPPNYASKSKLIEGDILKLTVMASGNFIYKQIGPVARKRMLGELVVDDEQDEYWVASDTNKWRILKASATYFKGESGDKVSFLVPQDDSSKWAAVENIIKENSESL
ncbi:hypothetical protein KJ885_05520 [Patescibacteria group bacterium]|nr:hypothetical protein [Patescibacteria group bacterium]